MKPPAGWKDYVGTYEHDGSEWGFTIRARSMSDALHRMGSIGENGRVDGELVAHIPVAPFWLYRLITWFRNRKDRQEEGR